MTRNLLPPVVLALNASGYAVRDALSRLLEGLEDLNLDSEEMGTLELVLAEVLNNVVEHAYPDGPSDASIEIHCAHRRDGLHLHIRDSGIPMPGAGLPRGIQFTKESRVEDLPEGGFGWFLIQGLTKDISYARIGEENHLRFRLAIALKPQEPI